MSYIGSTPVTQSFIAGTDYFNGNGSTTAFTLSRSVVSVNDIQATVNNVVQQPNDAYTVSGTTITFTSAPSAGTNNIYVRYLSTTTQAISPSQGTVGWAQLNADTQQDLGISFKNRIINGNMAIAQYTTSSVTVNADAAFYAVDRFQAAGQGSDGVYTIQQSSVAPTGFANSLLATVTTADASIDASQQYNIQQTIEGYNIADLNWGTANAKTVTLSFWVRSSVTGTFSGALRNAVINRSYPFSYSIASANTWTQISVTITGETTGTWGATNGSGINVIWTLGAGTSRLGTANSWQAANYQGVTGQTQWISTLGATFYLTGVQLEVGTQATTFTTAGGSYGAEFDLCRRYCEVYSGGTTAEGNIPQYFAQVDSAQRPEIMLTYYPKRAAPTISTTGNFVWNTAANTQLIATFSGTFVGTFTIGANLFFGTAPGVTPGTLSGVGCILFGISGGGTITISAEL